MKAFRGFRLIASIAALSFLLISAGCAGNVPATEPAQLTSPPEPAASSTPQPTATAEATVTSTPDSMDMVVPVSGGKILYQDNFTDPSTGWTQDKFDNYFIGYHEPEYYHVEVTSPNYKITVFAPGKQQFGDFTVEMKVMTSSSKTSPNGDFRYGVAFRRSGDQYYAFTISPRTKKWYILKSTPDALQVLKEGTDADIHDLDTDDTLRVDAKGPDFAFHINDHLVEQLTDADYASGEVGLYVESFDAAHTHIHFDSLVVQDYQAPVDDQQNVLYQDNFTDPKSNWPDKKFDNYFIGYHEPEYYHVEVTSPHYKTTVFEPLKTTFSDATIEMQVMTASKKTSATGDFRYGVAFRRSGDQYYAFTISPRTKKWFFLKSTPNALQVIKEGTDEDIHNLDTDDALRVDAQGPEFVLHINDKIVGQVSDPDYASGEVGLYVESFDSAETHVHFDSLTVRNFEVSVVCNVNALTINVRNGPGTDFPSSNFLKQGDTIQPLERSQDNQWIKIKTNDNGGQGWVFNSAGYLSCTPDVKLLPVTSPQN